MSLADLAKREEMRGDKVELILAELRRRAASNGTIHLGEHDFTDARKELDAFATVIADEVMYGHQEVANALNKLRLGCSVDRKQVHAFREKLRLGRVGL